MSKAARRPLRAAAIIALISSLPACIPYSVGTTALPVPRDSTVPTLLFTSIPSVARLDSSRGAAYLAVDGEVRRGIDARSDVGVRAVNMSGVVVNYKRLVTRPDEPALIAIMPGIGLVNLGHHAHFELTLLASRRERSMRDGQLRQSNVIPYGGARIMQVAPLTMGAVHDDPTIGAFFGVRLGRPDFAISPEIGVFHDRSALGMREHNVIVVPTIALHGSQLMDAVRRIPRWPPRGY